LRYGLGANSFDPLDDILAGAAKRRVGRWLRRGRLSRGLQCSAEAQHHCSHNSEGKP